MVQLLGMNELMSSEEGIDFLSESLVTGIIDRASVPPSGMVKD